MSLAPDGSKFFFCSRRPLQEGEAPNENFDFWMSEKTGEGWGTPQHLGDGVNSDSEDFYPVFTNLNHLYFNSQREGRGTNNIYRAQYNDGKFGKAVKLGPAVNTEYREFDPYAAPDESFIIFASERPGGLGRSDLYISFKKEDGAWTPAVNMGERINSEGSDFCPMLSPDGKYLFFTSNRSKLMDFPENPMDHTAFWKIHIESQNGLSDIYWVDAKIIEDIKSDNL
jgi:Tol biopolymer transport system component